MKTSGVRQIRLAMQQLAVYGPKDIMADVENVTAQEAGRRRL
jgi:hypothetical protein